MRKLIVVAVGAACVHLLPLRPAAAQDPLSQLGLTEVSARELATSVVVGRTMSSWVDPSIKRLFKAMPAGVRASVTRGTWAWAKNYLGSATFRAEYAKERAAAQPPAPTVQGSVDAELRQMIDEQMKSLAETRSKVLPLLPADQRPAMEAQLKQQEEMMKSAEYSQIMRMGIEQQRKGAQDEHARRVRQWEEDFPAAPQQLVARRLREFLAVCADVDFAARTTLVDGKQRFVNPAYEAKPPQWKECFRAGREPHAVAREAAMAWLAEVQRGTEE